MHIINPFWNAYGGSEQRALALYKLLKDETETHLWCGGDEDKCVSARYPLNTLGMSRGIFPRRGVFVFVGIYFGAGAWIANSRPVRKIVVVNTVQPDVAARMLVALGQAGDAPVEFVYASEATKAEYTMPGIVEPSLIDLKEFTPLARAPNARFTIGRLSRDHATKHHENDPEFYRRLTAAGFAVRVMGGSVLAKAMTGNVPAHLSLLPAGAEPAAPFLNSLDCFFYRTQKDWFEAYGRVVFEAMAAELPVVAGRNGGYADFIEHGVNGFLFDTDD